MDVTYALRTLRRSLGFTTSSILTRRVRARGARPHPLAAVTATTWQVVARFLPRLWSRSAIHAGRP
jgi:hypothetical protein